MATVLTDEDKALLFEIYGLTESPDTTIVLGFKVVYPSSISPYLLSGGSSNLKFNNVDSVAVQSLNNAIIRIDARPAYVSRVQEIIAGYRQASLDPQTTSGKNGYTQLAFIKNVRTRLYPYTSLLVRDVDSNSGNQINLA